MLDKIIAGKKEEVERRKKTLPLSHLRERIAQQKPPLDFLHALNGNHIKLIAEVKQASPSRGILRSNLNHVELARIYAKGGAASISVLSSCNFPLSLSY